MVWDESGLVAYEDLPERRMSHLWLAFMPSTTPEQPNQPTGVIIDINGACLTGETTERTLPRMGSTPIVEGFGRRYFYEADRYVLDFMFERRSDERGRKTGVRRLASLSFSWR